MPQIRTYQQQVGSTGAFDQAQATGQAFGAGVHREMAKLGAQTTEMVVHLDRANTNAKADAAVSQAQKELTEYGLYLRKGRINQEDGAMEGPPPAEQHETLYNEKLEDIKSRYGEALGQGRAMSRFEAQLDPFAQRESINVRVAAIDKYTGQIKGNIELGLRNYAQVESTTPEYARPEVRRKAMASIDDAESAGVMTPEQATGARLQYEREVNSGVVYDMVKNSPNEALINLQAGMFDKTMSVSEKQQWIRSATEEGERQERLRVASEEKRERDVAKAEGELQQMTASSLWAKSFQGDLTLDEVMVNKDALTKQDFVNLSNEASGRAGVKTDPRVYSPLVLRAAKGENIQADANRAYQNGQIDKAGFDRLVNMTTSGASRQDPRARTAKEYMKTALGADSAYATGGERARAAEAVLRFNSYLDENPQATQKEVETEAMSLVEQARFVDPETLTTLFPRFAKGRQGAKFDVQKTAEETLRKYEAGEIDMQTLERESKLIDDWTRINEANQAMQDRLRGSRDE